MDSDSTQNEKHGSRPRQGDDDSGKVVTEEPAEDTSQVEAGQAVDADTAESVTEDEQEENSTAPAAEGEAAATISLVKYDELSREKDDLYDRLLRKQAEFENFRKRTEKEKQEFYDFALSKFLQDLLQIADGLERGLMVNEGEAVENYKKGFELVLRQLQELLTQVGVQSIAAMGKPFDPNHHQAVMREESSQVPENEVTDELQRGYTFKDRLLRPSLVKVAVAPASPSHEPSDNESVAEEPDSSDSSGGNAG